LLAGLLSNGGMGHIPVVSGGFWGGLGHKNGLVTQ
jgi:hypothetical protein